MEGDHLALGVASRKYLKDRSNSSGQDANPHEYLPVLDLFHAQNVERSKGGHHESSRDYCSAHRVKVLPNGPLVQKQRPKTAEMHRTVFRNSVAQRSLHPRISSNNEIS